MQSPLMRSSGLLIITLRIRAGQDGRSQSGLLAHKGKRPESSKEGARTQM